MENPQRFTWRRHSHEIAEYREAPAPAGKAHHHPPRRTRSFSHRFERRVRSVAELISPPWVPSMPEDPLEHPERYAQCMRLLWLAASMKAFDVVVILLATDEANVAMCELIGDMVPMLQFTRKRDPSPPQVVVALSENAAVDAHLEFYHLRPAPLVIPRAAALPSLVCEVLHPAAHWSGSLEAEKREDEDKGGGTDGRPTSPIRRGSSSSPIIGPSGGSRGSRTSSPRPSVDFAKDVQGGEAKGGGRSSPLLRRANTIGATAMETFLQPRFSPRSPLSTTRRTGGEPRQGSSLRGRSNSAHDHVLDRSLGLL